MKRKEKRIGKGILIMVLFLLLNSMDSLAEEEIKEEVLIEAEEYQCSQDITPDAENALFFKVVYPKYEDEKTKEIIKKENLELCALTKESQTEIKIDKFATKERKEKENVIEVQYKISYQKLATEETWHYYQGLFQEDFTLISRLSISTNDQINFQEKESTIQKHFTYISFESQEEEIEITFSNQKQKIDFSRNKLQKLCNYQFDEIIVEENQMDYLNECELKEGSLSFFTGKIGEITLLLKGKSRFFLAEQEKYIKIHINQPLLPDNVLLFDGITWEEKCKEFFKKNSTEEYWYGKPIQVEINKENPFIKEGCYYFKQDMEKVVLPASIMQGGIQIYKFLLRNSETGVEGIRNYKLGIDMSAPVCKSYQLKYPTEVIEEDNTLLCVQEPCLTMEFSDLESGVSKIVLSYFCNDQKLEKIFEQTDVIENYIFSDGNYRDIKIVAYDLTGNKSDEIDILEGKNMIVDTIIPEISVEVHDQNKNVYNGGWTNQQLCFDLQVKVGCSGIKKVEYTYVPKGSKIDLQKEEWIEILKDKQNQYRIFIGEMNTEINKNTDKPDIEKAETRKISTIRKIEQKQELRNEYKNGYFYFRITANVGTQNKVEKSRQYIRLQQRELDENGMEVLADKTPDKMTGWYNQKFEKQKPVFSFFFPEQIEQEYKEEEAPAIVTLYCQIENKTTGKIQKIITKTKYEESNEIKKLVLIQGEKYLLEQEGEYYFYLWAADEAGNRSKTLLYLIKADYTPPADLQICIGDEIINAKKETFYYHKIVSNSLTVSTGAEFGTSKIESLNLYKGKQKENKDKISWKKFDTEKVEMQLLPDQRCYIYALAIDQAGNETFARSDGIIIDEKMPTGMQENDITINPVGENENGFFAEDFKVELGVKDAPYNDNCSSLKEISYRIKNEKKDGLEEMLFHHIKENLTEEELNQNQEWGGLIQVNAAEYESNQTYIEIRAIDQAGNEKISQKEVAIDVTLPEIEVSYDDASSPKEVIIKDELGSEVEKKIYCASKRKAVITINELNFSPSLVEFDITKNNEIYNLPVENIVWRTDGSNHYTEIPFTEDGTYTVTLSCKDLAGNEAEYSRIDTFVIDQTFPQYQISYEQNECMKEGYYKTKRTAVITIEEQNFKEADFEIYSNSEYKIEDWSHQNQMHKVKIGFYDEGKHEFSFQISDMAGNVTKSDSIESFIIDLTKPEISIEGIKDMSANAKEILPVIIIEDMNFNHEGVFFQLINSKGKEIKINWTEKIEAQKGTFSLTNLTKQEDEIYSLSIKAIDLAGNEEQETIRFSLNRNGSTYDLQNIRNLLQKQFIQFANLSDLSIKEMNVNQIEENNLYVSKNGKILNSKECSVYPLQEEENTIYYKRQQTGNEQMGYCYTYTIFKENFQEEGKYHILIYSKDKAGNEINNTLKEKNADISFQIDNTPPEVVIEGIESGHLYLQDEIETRILVKDNFKLKKAEFFLYDEKGKCIQKWDYLKLVQKQGDYIVIKIPNHEQGMYLTYELTDEANNGRMVKPGETEAINKFWVSANLRTYFWNRISYRNVMIGAAIMILICAGIIVGKKQKKHSL